MIVIYLSPLLDHELVGVFVFHLCREALDQYLAALGIEKIPSIEFRNIDVLNLVSVCFSCSLRDLQMAASVPELSFGLSD